MKKKTTEKLFIDKTKTIKISSVKDLIKSLDDADKNKKNKEEGYPIYLRGQAKSDSWGLEPSIARTKFSFMDFENIKQFKKEQEEKLLNRFRRHSYEYKGRVLGEWETIFLARHHYLPVRLLDWTTNPLVALYWASASAKEEDGAIWIFWRRGRKQKEEVDIFDPKSKLPKKIKGVRLIYPFYPTPRMTAQSAVFTIHQYPWKDLSKMTKPGYPKKNMDIKCGEKWLIPKDKKIDILMELERFGVNARILFPDLAGVAEGLLHRELLFPSVK